MEKLIIDTSAGTIFGGQRKKNYNDINVFLQHYKDVVDNSVKGWFYPVDMILFHFMFKQVLNIHKGDTCELGVAFGKSAIGLSLLREQDENLYLFDNFAAEITKEEAAKNIDTYGRGDNIIWNTDDLTKIDRGRLSFESSIKFLHVDACHLHSAVLEDLRNFSPSVFGIICVDDFNDIEYPGINSAVTRFCLESDYWNIFVVGQNKAYLCQNHMHNNYSKMVTEYLSKNVPQLGLTIAESVNRNFPFILTGSRSPMEPQKILDILDGKLEIAYT